MGIHTYIEYIHGNLPNSCRKYRCHAVACLGKVGVDYVIRGCDGADGTTHSSFQSATIDDRLVA